MSQVILVLPAGMPAAIRYARANRDRLRLIGASSNRYEPAAGEYAECHYLPHVSDPDFLPALRGLLRRAAVTAIVCQHQVVWSLLDQSLTPDEPPLLNPPPIPAMLSPYQAALQDALVMRSLAHQYGYGDNLPPELALAGIVRHIDDLPGECDRDKYLLFLLAASTAPAGDLVEIGSLWGRSAYLLAWLANYYDLGNLLCIDPWSVQAAVQHSLNDQLVKLSSSTHDISAGFQVFCQNMLAGGFNNSNYLRMLSNEAVCSYRDKNTVETCEFGLTRYEGSISILHIDGNHDLDVVRQDVADWCPLVKPGGWIIIDDYTWKFGDGPRMTGDEFVKENAANIACSFVMGGALAIRMAR